MTTKRWVGSLLPWGLVGFPWSDVDSFRDIGVDVPFTDAPRERLAGSPLALLAALAALGESLLENMRVKRSFTEAFSGAVGLSIASGLLAGGAPLVAPAAAGSGVPAGDFAAASWDLMDDGFELGADDGLESPGLVVDIVR